MIHSKNCMRERERLCKGRNIQWTGMKSEYIYKASKTTKEGPDQSHKLIQADVKQQEPRYCGSMGT
jgi:hypothetical protein